MRRILPTLVLSAFCALLTAFQPQAVFAGDATITNNGTTPAYVRTKTGSGSYGFDVVDPGKTLTLPSSVQRVRVNQQNPGCTVTKTDGTTVKIDASNDGESIAVVPETTGITVRSGEGVIRLPNAAGNTVAANASKAPAGSAGIGAPPAASDGPVIFPGGLAAPRHYAGDSTWEGVQNGLELSDQDIKDLKEMFSRPEDAARYVREWDEFWDMMSGSGDRFGDNATTDFVPVFGYPGHAYGGLPRGSWVHFSERQILTVSRDSTLIQALDTDNFSTLFSNQFGGSPVEVRYEQY